MNLDDFDFEECYKYVMSQYLFKIWQFDKVRQVIYNYFRRPPPGIKIPLLPNVELSKITRIIMERLEDIGFYTLSDYRASQCSASSPLWRCELLLTDRCNFHCPYCIFSQNLAPLEF